MTVKASMETYAARLASFNAAHPPTKKRTSEARGAKALRWPHKSPSPPQLARAGFFYQPTVSRLDNTICYLCESHLDGWEADDDAVEEHLKHSPDCGWAITIAIEQDIEHGSYSLEDPMCEKVLRARRMTFGSNWPHENKRGWTCKTQKMIEAGWHYCPTLESDDFVKCSYCNLSLDGWEPKDKPFDEHQRRSPDCSFFTLYASIKTKPGRPKKNRASKASRLSAQSNVTAVSEGLSVAEMEPNPDESIVSTTESVKPTKPIRGKKATKTTTKVTGKAKGRGTKARQEESQIASSFLEPEDDDFEVKVDQSPAPVSSNRKRKSKDMSTANDNRSILQADEDTQSQAPRKRQRRTRASSSTVQAQEVPITTSPHDTEIDAAMTDAEIMPPPPGPNSKKGGKGGKKRASSTARKASSASTASKASLRANVPADEAIEAALEAELDRPLTDEEGDAEPVEVEQPKGRRLTRTKPGSKKATASVAPTRIGTKAGSISAVESPATGLYPSLQNQPVEEHSSAIATVEDAIQPDEVVEASPEVIKRKAKTSRKQQAQQQDRKDEIEAKQEPLADADDGKTQRSDETSQPRQSRSRHISRQLVADDAAEIPSDIKSSMLATQTLQDDSGHETDGSVLKQSRTKRGGQNPPAAAKKAKRGKKAALKSRVREDIDQAPTVEVQIDEINTDNPKATPDDAQSTEPETIEPKPVQEEAQETEETKSPKTGGKAGKIKAAANEYLPPVAPEQSDVVIELQDTPVLPPPSLHSTPRPALSLQSSDAENQPPSSRPSKARPPLTVQSPSRSQVTKVPLAITPIASPSKGSFSRLQSTFPWTAVDLENVFHGTPSGNKANDPFVFGASGEGKGVLTSPEKKLTVEEWIQSNAQRGEERLRNECERLVGKFEGEGVRALRTLEGIVCAP